MGVIAKIVSQLDVSVKVRRAVALNDHVQAHMLTAQYMTYTGHLAFDFLRVKHDRDEDGYMSISNQALFTVTKQKMYNLIDNHPSPIGRALKSCL
jgi:hypothetical protein